MKNLAKILCGGSAFLVALLSSQSARTEIVYDNSVNDWVSGYSSTNEFGDQIKLAGTSRTVSKFTFEYFGVGADTGGTATVTLRFYLNDVLSGGYYGPGTPLWTSDPFTVSPTGRSTLIYDPNIFIGKDGLSADEFTWTVQFTDLTGGGTWGLDIYSPPTVGSSYNDYWEFDALGEWLLKTNRFDVPMNFAARVEAIPEPNAVVLGLAGALAILLFRASLRRV